MIAFTQPRQPMAELPLADFLARFVPNPEDAKMLKLFLDAQGINDVQGFKQISDSLWKNLESWISPQAGASLRAILRPVVVAPLSDTTKSTSRESLPGTSPVPKLPMGGTRNVHASPTRRIIVTLPQQSLPIITPKVIEPRLSLAGSSSQSSDVAVSPVVGKMHLGSPKTPELSPPTYKKPVLPSQFPPTYIYEQQQQSKSPLRASQTGNTATASPRVSSTTLSMTFFPPPPRLFYYNRFTPQ